MNYHPVFGCIVLIFVPDHQLFAGIVSFILSSSPKFHLISLTRVLILDFYDSILQKRDLQYLHQSAQGSLPRNNTQKVGQSFFPSIFPRSYLCLKFRWERWRDTDNVTQEMSAFSWWSHKCIESGFLSCLCIRFKEMKPLGFWCLLYDTGTMRSLGTLLGNHTVSCKWWLPIRQLGCETKPKAYWEQAPCFFSRLRRVRLRKSMFSACPVVRLKAAQAAKANLCIFLISASTGGLSL